MVGTMVTLLVLWIIISIPAALIIGRFLAASNASQDDVVENVRPVKGSTTPLPYSK